MPWKCRKFDWDEYSLLKPEDSHYLICSNCGHIHMRYSYNVWTNTLSACSYLGKYPAVPVFCSQCGEKMLDDKPA